MLNQVSTDLAGPSRLSGPFDMLTDAVGTVRRRLSATPTGCTQRVPAAWRAKTDSTLADNFRLRRLLRLSLPLA